MSAAAPTEKRRSSLQLTLLAWVLAALALVWGSFVIWGYQTGVTEADELTDGHLASVASLALNWHVQGDVPVGETSAGWWQSYGFSDSFHPTPLAHQHMAELTRRALEKAGWL